MNGDIRINYPSDGTWVMLRVGGIFNDKIDHVIGVHDKEGKMRGGVVFTGYLGSAIMLHMAGDETNWAGRDFLWMVFDYAFNQLGVRKLIGLVATNNLRALSIDLRLGFLLEGRIERVFPDGSDLLLLTMTRPQCKWLDLKPLYYRSNQERQEVADGRREG
jgi:hypothetical protein